jgi:predicted O-methyltransferase YrrM
MTSLSAALRSLTATPRMVYMAAYRRVSVAERTFWSYWPRINEIEGFLVSPEQEHWLFRAALSLRDGANIVEIGSYKGRSTCSLGVACLGTKKHLYCVDTFSGNDTDFLRPSSFLEDFRANIAKCGVARHVSPLQGRSAEIAKTWSTPISLLFIDGSHQFEDVLADFRGFFPYVIPGGIVALHDVCEGWPGPSRAWNEHIRGELVQLGNCSTLAYGRKPPA